MGRRAHETAIVCAMAGLFLMSTTSHTVADWRAEADARIETCRKSNYVVTLKDANGRPLRNAAVAVNQTRSAFHFGVCVSLGRSPEALYERRYREFVVEHFNTIVSENAMKWYTVEAHRDRVSFRDADAEMAFAVENNLAMRGHCLFWSKQKFVQPWLQTLTPSELRQQMDDHLAAIVPRYRGRLIAWDVNNEMLDGSFYRDKLGDDVRAWMFRRARELDPEVPLYVNEYGILGSPEKTARYIELIRSLQQQGAPVSGIGIQEHACQRFDVPNRGARLEGGPDRAEVTHAGLTPEAMMASLDELAKLKLPIHLTEISVNTRDTRWRADSLEILYRLGYSHPQVECILLWGFWAKRHWLGADSALVDANWELTEAGKRLRHLLLTEWRTRVEGTTDDRGRLKFRGFHGDYLVTVTGRDGVNRQELVKLDASTPRVTVGFR